MEMERVSSWIRGSLIGAGAFGKVNLALNKDNGDLFAVKSIECNERTGGEMQAMENEVQVLQSLNSPFVVKCLGSSFSEEQGKSMRNVFIEYMSGGSLADLMKKFGGRFHEPLIRNYTRGILEGLQYLHSEDIVHCDIKGKNVLVGSSGVVKLADFGGARRLLKRAKAGEEPLSSTTTTTTTTTHSMLDSAGAILKVKGTPLWMAPEVVLQVEQGPASDIWSLGCTVVEMATGKAPWSDIASAANPFVALYHIGCTEQVPDLPSCLSEQGQDFLSKCFQRDPRERWTAEELLQHPFIADTFQSSAVGKADVVLSLQSSPTSAFDFPSPATSTAATPTTATTTTTLTSSIANSVPILRSPLFAKRFSQAANFFRTEDPSAVAAQAQAPHSSPSPDFWCNSPLNPPNGQWIVVRSPKTVDLPCSTSTSHSAELPVVASCEAMAVAETQQLLASLSQACGSHERSEIQEREQRQEGDDAILLPVMESSTSEDEDGEEIFTLDGDEEQQRDTRVTFIEDASSSDAKQLFCCMSCCEEKIHVPIRGRRRRICRSRNARAARGFTPTVGVTSRKKSVRNVTDGENNCFTKLGSGCRCSSGTTTTTTADDTRGIDIRERPKRKFASLGDTLKALASAGESRAPMHRRKKPPKPQDPQQQRSPVQRKSLDKWETDRWRVMALGRFRRSHLHDEFCRQTPQRPVDGRFVNNSLELLCGVKKQPPQPPLAPFFTNRLFLNKTDSPSRRLLYTFFGLPAMLTSMTDLILISLSFVQILRVIT